MRRILHTQRHIQRWLAYKVPTYDCSTFCRTQGWESCTIHWKGIFGEIAEFCILIITSHRCNPPPPTRTLASLRCHNLRCLATQVKPVMNVPPWWGLARNVVHWTRALEQDSANWYWQSRSRWCLGNEHSVWNFWKCEECGTGTVEKYEFVLLDVSSVCSFVQND